MWMRERKTEKEKMLAIEQVVARKMCIGHGELDRGFLGVEGGDKNHQGVLHRQPP
jgi:hypothetical protein